MNGMASASTAELHAYQVRLIADPAAAGQARNHALAALPVWSAPVDVDTVALLTSELVTNAIKYGGGGPIRLGIQCTPDRLLVEVHDTSPRLPVPMPVPGRN